MVRFSCYTLYMWADTGGLGIYTPSPPSSVAPPTVLSIGGGSVACECARVFMNGTPHAAAQCPGRGVGDSSVMKSDIWILHPTAPHNRYTFPVVKQMRNYELIINCKFRVSGEHIIGLKVYKYVAKDVGRVLPYMNQDPGNLSYTDPVYMYHSL